MMTVDIYKVVQVILVWTTSFIILQKTNAQQSSNGNYISFDSPYFFHQQSEYPRDCKEVHDQCPSSNSNGVHFIKPDGYPEYFEVYCDIGNNSAGWLVILRRNSDGFVSFNRDWDSFNTGFGFLSHEFWIGNERLSYLTNQKNYELLTELTLSDGSTFNMSYQNFRIGDSFSKYTLLSVSQYTGTTGWNTCPENMVYGSCSCGQRSCQEPSVCQNTCDGDGPIGCICPEGFYMNGRDCIPKEQCGCYVPEEQVVVAEGDTYINKNCTRISVCSNRQLARNGRYECSGDAVCEERDGERRCYCKEGFVGDGETCPVDTFTDCMDVYNAGNTASGTYIIKPAGWPGTTFSVYCNMTDEGGWTVFQRRIDGSVDFYLDWDDYKNGFGNVDHEHWLGNEQLYYITNQRRYQIRTDLVNTDGDPYYAKFDSFRINNETDNYRLSEVGSYSGNADDGSSGHPAGYALIFHRGKEFTTRDSDNDDYDYSWASSNADYYNCAFYCNGAWWYDGEGGYCYYSNLNGYYYYYYFYIYYLPGSNYLTFSEMKLRPI